MLLKGQFTPKSKTHVVPLPPLSCSFISASSFEDIDCSDVCLRSNIMELDCCRLVALEATTDMFETRTFLTTNNKV